MSSHKAALIDFQLYRLQKKDQTGGNPHHPALGVLPPLNAPEGL